MTKPISFSDAQMLAIVHAGRGVPPIFRARFLECIADFLKAKPDAPIEEACAHAARLIGPP